MHVERGGFEVTDHHDGDEFWTTMYPGWEPELEWVLQHVPTGGTLIDIGAWIGPWTLNAAVRGIRVEAWEPDHVAYIRLLDNLRLNDLTNVRPWCAALTPDDTAAYWLHAQADIWGGSNSGRWAQGTIHKQTAGVPIQQALQPGAFVKMDVEGDELDLFPIVADHGLPCHVSLHAPLARIAGDPVDYRSALEPAFRRYRHLYLNGRRKITVDTLPYDELCSITCLNPR